MSVEFYGPCCDKNLGCNGDPAAPACGTGCTVPSPSYWLPSLTGQIQFSLMCENTGMSSEPNPSKWVAQGTMKGATGYPPYENFYNTYKVRCAVNVAGANTISVSGSMWWLDPTKTWRGYTSFSSTLTEIPTTYMPPFRQRNFRSGYIPITTSVLGGEGDPVSFVVITVVMIPIRGGCGSLNNSVPLCGFWDYTGWHSCFRAHVEGNNPSSLDGMNVNHGRFYQLGLDGSPCGGGSNPNFERFCACDVINNGGAINTHTSEKNSDPAFLAEYAVIGVPGENDPYSRQQIQIGGPLCVKNVNNGPIYLGYKNSLGAWEVIQPSVVQTEAPHIYKAIFSDTTVWLYSLRFPSLSILPESCNTWETGPDCGGSCQYIYSELAEAWILQPGNCGEWSGCSCGPPDPAYIVPGGYMLVPCYS